MFPCKMNKIVFILFLMIFLNGCTEQRGKIVVRDYVPAKQVVIPNFQELQQSAAQGDAEAQFQLGRLYADGLGVPKSHRKAMEYWQSAAGQEHALAQYGLGWMYFYGSGVMTDFNKGCYWLQRAGTQGVQNAINYYNELCVTAR